MLCTGESIVRQISLKDPTVSHTDSVVFHCPDNLLLVLISVLFW